MPLRWQEVAVPLGVVLLLVILKYVPATADLPLARLAGIVAFGYAAFLALRLIQAEEAVVVDGWSELRASPVELFIAFGGAGLAALMVSAVGFGGAATLPPAQMLTAYGLALALAAASLAIVSTSIMVRIRWNQTGIERRDARGVVTALAWRDVVAVKGRWNCITISAGGNRRVIFSPLQSGAAQLATFAARRARRNALPAAQAFWGQGS